MLKTASFFFVGIEIFLSGAYILFTIILGERTMKAIRGIYRFILCVAMPLLTLLFIATIFSISSTYGYEVSSTSNSSSITITVLATLSFLSPLLSGSDFGLTYITTGEADNVTYDASSGVSFDMVIKDTEMKFTPMTFSLNTLMLIGVVVVLIGAFLAICTHKKVGSFFASFFLLAGAIVIFSQGKAFDAFSFVLASSDASKEPLVNVSLSYISTGIVLIAMTVISLLNSLLLLSKKGS